MKKLSMLAAAVMILSATAFANGSATTENKAKSPEKKECKKDGKCCHKKCDKSSEKGAEKK